QRILRLDKLCRRLEVEEEKMLPFYPSSLDDGEQQNAQQVLQEMPVEPLAQALQDYVELERFWERLNKAKMEEQVLEREGMRLRERNQQLREMLKQYLDRISVNQEVVEINPL
ncbi:DRC2 protein, partial [Alcedo cyanopectus]|nr:DRC2 protein [Ceyx cyanopectus]